MDVVFYIAAACALVATVLVVTRANAVHALLWLVVSLFSTAIVFWTLGAPFVAVLEVILYSGAIMVLFLFAVMLLKLGPESTRAERALLPRGIWIGPAAVGLVLAAELVYAVWTGADAGAAGAVVGPREVGTTLLGSYLLGVELASLLLLVGLVGAYHLGRRDRRERSERAHEAEPPADEVTP